MSREIDQRIVEMEFDNQEFERRISTTTKSLGKLKEALNLDDAAEGFDQIQNSVSRIDLSKLADISVMALAKFKLVSQVLDDVIGKTKQFVKSVTIEPVSQGWQKYADITQATQTIMAATAKDFENEAEQIETVNAQLEKLNWFTDETSYNLTDMTNNIGKFTSNGVKLETAVTAMQGIGTWASISGQGVSEASRAMYNLSQALGTGSIQLRDWMSIENANMATSEFKTNAIETAAALGTLKKVGDGVYQTLSGNEVTAASFRENLKDDWFTAEVLMKTLDKYGGFTNKLNEYYNETGLLTSEILEYVNAYSKGTLDLDKVAKSTGVSVETLTEMVTELSKSEYELGRKSFAAAQEAKTFKEAIEATQDAVSTGWMKSFQLIFGDYKEAKKVWTALANELYDVFAAPGEFRNEVLTTWSTMIDEITGLSGRQMWFGDFDEQAGIIGNVWENVKNIVGAIKDGIASVFLIIDSAEDIGTKLFQFSKWLRNVTSDLVLTEDQVEHIKDAVAGLMRPVKFVIDLVASIIKPTTKFITKTVGYVVSTLAPEILNFARVIGNLFKSLRKGDGFEGITTRLEKLYSALFRVVRFVTDVMSRMISVPTAAIQRGLDVYEKWIRGTEKFATSVSYAVKVALITLVRGFGTALTELTGFQWFTDFSEKIVGGIDSISKKLKTFTNSVKEIYTLGGEGFRGVVATLLTFGGKAFQNVTTWLTKITGIKWFENFGNNAVANIQKAKESLATFFDEFSQISTEYGGGAKGFLSTFMVESGKLVKSGFGKLADLTGIEWFRTVGDKLSAFFDRLREHISAFVDTASEILSPFKSLFTNIFGGKEKIEDPTEQIADSAEANVARTQVAYKSLSQLALEIIRGDWGNGVDRDNALWGAGYDNDKAQALVNQIWTLTGEFKEGYQEILKEYENVDGRMEGYVLPIKPNDRKNKKLVEFVVDAEGAVVKTSNRLKKETKSVSEQFEESREKIFAVLPILFTKIGAAVATVAIKLRALWDSIITYIEENQLITRFVDWLFKAAESIGNFFTAISGFVKSVWPSFKAFFINAAKAIANFVKTGLGNIKDQLKSIGRLFKGTGTLLSEFMSSVFSGDWASAGNKISEIFTKIRENYDKETKWFAYKMYKLHGPIAEFLKFLVIAKNVIVAAVKGIAGGIRKLFFSAEEGTEDSMTAFDKFVVTIKNIGSFFPTIFAGTKEIFENLQLSLLLSDWTKAGERFSKLLGQIRKNIDDNYPGLSKTITSIETFLNAYGPKFKEFGANVLGFLKTASAAAWNGVKATWEGLKKTFAGTGWMFKNVFDGILEMNWGKIKLNLTYIWNNLWNNLKNVLSDAVDSIAAKYPKLGGILTAIRDFLQKYGPMFRTAADNIKNFFSSITTNAFNGVTKLFSGTGDFFSKIFSSLLSGDFGASKEATKGLTRALSANISAGYQAALDNAEENNPRLYGILKTLKAFKDRLSSIFGSISETIKTKFPNLKESFIKGFEAIKKGFRDLLPMFGNLLGSLFKFDFKGVWGAVKNIFNYLYNAFSSTAKSFFTKLKNFFEPFFEDPLGVISNLIGKLGQAPKAIVEFFKDLLSFGSKENTGKTPSKMDLKKVKDAILGVLDVIRAIGGALTSFRAAAMFKSITSATKGIGGLAESAKEVLDTKFLGKKSKVQTFVDTLKMLAIIFVAVVAAIIILGNQDPSVIERGQEAAAKIAFAIIGFVVIIKLLDKVLGKDSGGSFANLGKSFLSLSLGLIVMYFAIKSFSKLDAGTMAKGLISLGLALLELMIFTKLMFSKKQDGSINDVGKQFLLLAVGIIALSLAIKILGGMDTGKLVKGFIALTAILLALGIFAQFLRSKEGQMLKVGKTLIFMAAAMYVMTFAIERLGNMNFVVMAKGLIGITIGLLAMGIAVKKMKNVKASTAVTILALSAALLILTSSVESLGKLSLGVLAKGIGAVVILLGSLSGATLLLSQSKAKFSTAFSSALILGELLLALYIAVQIMEEMEGEGYLEKAEALSLLVGTIGGIAALLAKTKPSIKTAVPSAILLLELIGTAFAAVVMLNELDDGVTLEKAEALSLVVGTMGAMASLLAATSTDFTSGKDGALLMIGMGASAIEAAIALRALDDIDNLQEKANALSTVVGTMGGVATLLSLKGLSFGTGAKAAAGLVSFIGTFIAGMAILGALKYGIDFALSFIPEGLVQNFTGGDLKQLTIDDLIGNVIPSLEKFAEAFGTMAGKFVGSFKAAELETSAGAMASFFNDFEAPSEEKQQAVGGAVTFLSDLEKNLPPKDGVFQWFFGGGTSWSTISDGLAEFGKALAKFSTYCLVVNKESVQRGAEAGKALTETLEGLPQTPGKISSWFEGTYKWSTISTGLADFGTALLKFSNSCLLVNKASVEKGASAGASLATTLKELPMTPGKISRWFEGTYDWSTISTGLVDFGTALAGFSKEVKGDAIDGDKVKIAADAGLSLAQTLSALPEKPSDLQAWFSGTNGTWSDLSTGLAGFGTALADFSNNVSGAVYNDNVKNAVGIAESLAGVAEKIPVSGSFYNLVFGQHDMGEFAEGITQLGSALLNFSLKTILMNTSKTQSAVDIASNLADIAAKLPQEDGFIAWITGFDQYTIGEFGTDIESLGNSLKKFSNSVKGIDTTKTNDAVTIAGNLTEIANALPTDGGLMTWVFGDQYSMETFGTEIEKLGGGIKKFSDSVIGIDTTSTKLAVTVAKNICAIVKETQGFNEGNANDLTDFCEALADSAAEIDGMDGTNLTIMANLFASMASAPENMVSNMETLATKAITAFNNALLSTDNSAIFEKIGNNFAILVKNQLLGENYEGHKKLIGGFKSAANSSINAFNNAIFSSDNASLYDTIVSNFRKMITNRLSNDDNAERKKLINAFKTLATAGVEEFSNTFNSEEIRQYYDSALDNFRSKVVNRVSGVTGSYKKDILEKFENLALDAAKRFRWAFQGWSELATACNEAVGYFRDKIIDRVSGNIGQYRDNILESFKKLAKDAVAEFANVFSSKTSTDRYASSINYLKSYVCSLLQQASANMIMTVVNTFNSGYNLVYHAARRMVQGVIDGVNGRYVEVYSVGANTMQGLINGMNAMAPAVNATAHSLSTGVATYLRQPLKVYSPSRVTTEIGEFIGQGLINGMINKQNDVWEAAGSVSTGVADVMNDIIQNATYAMEQDATPTITPVVDMSNVTRSASYINGLLGGTYGYGVNTSIAAAQAARVGTVSVTAQQLTRDANYQDSLESIRADIRGLSDAIQSMQIVMDSGALVGQIAAPMDNALGRRYMHQTRRN